MTDNINYNDQQYNSIPLSIMSGGYREGDRHHAPSHYGSGRTPSRSGYGGRSPEFNGRSPAAGFRDPYVNGASPEFRGGHSPDFDPLSRRRRPSFETDSSFGDDDEPSEDFNTFLTQWEEISSRSREVQARIQARDQARSREFHECGGYRTGGGFFPHGVSGSRSTPSHSPRHGSGSHSRSGPSSHERQWQSTCS